MATTSLINIDNVAIYSHFDGYEVGMCLKLIDMINTQFQIDENNVKNVGYINAFIASNITNTSIVKNANEYHCNYTYNISSSNNTIEVFKDNYEDDKMIYVETLSIFDFICKYSKFFNRETRKYESIFDKDEVILEVTKNYYNSKTIEVYTKQTAINLLKFYKKQLKRFTKSNPNFNYYIEKINEIKNAKRFKIKA
ncbi:MAG: hypothetical protein RBR23_01060 [Arcobacteraceae bacterium]|jgi:hypothetical protein|nr:hypothetical protein [Arcobacteraceae bacterium]